MAGAPSPERPVVLRRLGIIKDPDDSSLQESRAPRENPEDALELFATEAGPAPRRGQWLNAIRSRAVSSFDVVRRHAAIGVIILSAFCVGVGLWAINRLVGSDVSSAVSNFFAVTPADTSAAGSADASAETPPDLPAGASKGAAPSRAANPSKVPTVVNAAGTGAPPRDQRPARESGGTAAVARPARPSQQPDRLVAAPPIVTTESAPAAPLVSEAIATVVDDTIYSAQDRDVIPPQTDERLPGPTISSWTTRTNAMEVIVSQTGAVERVRLVTPPQRMPDMFVLSRAKVWTFTPAMKDGRPVRYRLLLTWEVNP